MACRPTMRIAMILKSLELLLLEAGTVALAAAGNNLPSGPSTPVGQDEFDLIRCPNYTTRHTTTTLAQQHTHSLALMRSLFLSIAIVLAAILVAPPCHVLAASLNDKCFAQFASPQCGASGKACAMLCGMCVDAGTFMLQLDPHSVCNNATPSLTDAQVYNIAVGAIMNISALHGYRFMDDPGDVEEHATDSLLHLITYMPVRDVLVLFGDPLHTIFYLLDHIRYAYLARRSSVFASKVVDTHTHTHSHSHTHSLSLSLSLTIHTGK